MRSVFGKLTAAVGVAATALTLTMGPASADPPAGVVPKATDVVSVGSDTIQAYDNGLSAAYNATAPASKYYSWDATGSTPITPKAGALSIARPNGSSAGIAELAAVSHTTVDVARSSRAPIQGTDPNTDLFIAFAKDAVGWSGFTSTSTVTTDSPSTLSVTDLQGIYGTCAITNWNQVTDIPGYTGPNAAIKAYLPQSSSGTRKFFLSALGITTPGSCVQAYTPEENEGTDAVFNNPAVVYPYSIAHYIGQVYNGKGSGTDEPGFLDALRSVKFSSTSTIAQITNKLITTAFANSIFGRNVYHVVRSADWNSAVQGPPLKALFDKSTGTPAGYVCSNPTLITSFGFLALSSTQCGTQSHTT